MPVEAKQLLLREIESTLADKLTAAALEATIDELESRLLEFTVERDPVTCRQDAFDEMMAAFVEAKRIEGRSDKTLERYCYILGRLRDETLIPIDRMTVFTLRSWLAKEQQRGISDSTLEGDRCVFSSFFGWLHKEGLLAGNPCANLGAIKCRKQIKVPYSEIDIEVLKEACECPRDKALISFLLSTGCRISEVCALNRDSVNLHDLECKVLGKGNKERIVFIDNVTAMLLQRYLSERTDSSVALFAGRATDRITPGGVRARLSKIAERAMVARVHPHRFRRTLATNLIQHGMQIQEVAAILGHEKLDTTMKYVYLSKQNIKNAYQKYA